MKKLFLLLAMTAGFSLTACDGDTAQPDPNGPAIEHPDNQPGGVDECPRSDGEPCR